VAVRTSDKPEEYRRAAHDEAPGAVWLDAIRRFPDMKTLTETDIVDLIRHPTDHSAATYARLRRDAPVSALVAVLRTRRADPSVRRVVVDVLGYRRARSAVPLLIEALDDNDPSVRDAAADALGKIGDRRAGEALMRRLTVESDRSLRHWLVASLGGVGYQPAVPALLRLLSDPDSVVRHMAARSLGLLRAVEARAAIEEALAREVDSYPRRQMEQTLEWLNSPELLE
jgi:HEAT repeat protein